MLVGRNLHDLGVMNGSLLRLLEEVAPKERGGAAEDEDEDGGRRLGRQARRLRPTAGCWSASTAAAS